MSELVFYNQKGKPVAYIEDEEHIYTYSGTPVAFLHDDSVYSFKGKHLGRFNDGWIRDNSGKCVFFTNDAKGGPVKPSKGIKPSKGVKSSKPIKSSRKIKPSKPIKSSSWSSLSSEIFFEQ